MASAAQIRANRENAQKAGRPKGSMSAHNKLLLEKKKWMERQIVNELAGLVAAWKESGLGHFVKEETENGQTKVYKKSPNSQAIKDMIERVYGKPTGSVDLTSQGEKIPDLQAWVYAAIAEGTVGSDEA